MQISMPRFAFVTLALLLSTSSYALTMQEALKRAYLNNPDLNQQRAALRVTNESVPAALSGYRPSLSGTASLSGSKNEITNYAGSQFENKQYPRTASITASQPIFDGLRARNSVNAAENSVLVGREDLRNKEQTIFLAVITAYMNVIRDEATVALRKQAVTVAERDLKMLKERFRLGDASRTDVGLVEAQLGLSKLNLATSSNALALSKSVFLQHVGTPATKLSTPNLSDKIIPKTMERAQSLALVNSPIVKAAQHGADVAHFQVHVAESALYPQLSLDGTLSRGLETSSGVAKLAGSSVAARLTLPIFAGGGKDYSTIRAAKETLGQRQIQIDTAREVVKQSLGASWGLYTVSQQAISASSAEIKGREQVVRGFREEYKVGQRILQNVLVEEVNLNNARVTQVNWQRERAVAYFSILASIGQLNARSLNLKVDEYNPTAHYGEVRDAWVGVKTPDGR